MRKEKSQNMLNIHNLGDTFMCFSLCIINGFEKFTISKDLNKLNSLFVHKTRS